MVLVLLRLLWQNAATFKLYKTLHKLVLVYLQDVLMFSENVTGFVGRNSRRLFIPRMQTTSGQKNLILRMVVARNNSDQTLYSAK